MNKKELRALKNIKESLIQIALAGDNCNTDEVQQELSKILKNNIYDSIANLENKIKNYEEEEEIKLNQTIKEMPNNVYYSHNEDKNLIKYIAGGVLWRHNEIVRIENMSDLDLIIDEVTTLTIKDNCLYDSIANLENKIKNYNEDIVEIKKQVKKLLLKKVTIDDIKEIAINNTERFNFSNKEEINSIKFTKKIRSLLLINKEIIVNNSLLKNLKLNCYITITQNFKGNLIIE
jgi:regulator of replication initiation timing